MLQLFSRLPKRTDRQREEYAALLRGRIPASEAFLAPIQKKGWDSFEALWNKVLKILPNVEVAQRQAFAVLKKRVYQAPPSAGVIYVAAAQPAQVGKETTPIVQTSSASTLHAQ